MRISDWSSDVCSSDLGTAMWNDAGRTTPASFHMAVPVRPSERGADRPSAATMYQSTSIRLVRVDGRSMRYAIHLPSGDAAIPEISAVSAISRDVIWLAAGGAAASRATRRAARLTIG